MTKRTDPTEAIIHKNVANRLKQILPQRVFWTTVEVSNQRGGHQAMIQQRRQTARGVKTGFPDIMFVWKDGLATKMFCIELKRKYQNAKDVQLECHNELAAVGVPTAVCRSVEDVEKALQIYNVPTILKRT